MKVIISAFLLVWFMQAPAPKNHSEDDPKQGSAKARKREEANPARAVIQQSFTNSQPCTPDARKQAADADTEPHKGLEMVNACSTIVIAIFAVVTAITVIFQVRTSRTIERAWMVARVEGEVIPESEGVRLVRFSVRCMNNGKTPAFLLEMGNHGVVLPREELLPEPQPPCDEPNTDIWEGEGIPLQPGDSVLRRNFSTIAPDLKRLIHGQDWMWVYGYIKYRDAFGKARETRYCFLWDCVSKVPGLGEESNFLVRGPASYSRAT